MWSGRGRLHAAPFRPGRAFDRPWHGLGSREPRKWWLKTDKGGVKKEKPDAQLTSRLTTHTSSHTPDAPPGALARQSADPRFSAHRPPTPPEAPPRPEGSKVKVSRSHRERSPRGLGGPPSHGRPSVARHARALALGGRGGTHGQWVGTHEVEVEARGLDALGCRRACSCLPEARQERQLVQDRPSAERAAARVAHRSGSAGLDWDGGGTGRGHLPCACSWPSATAQQQRLEPGNGPAPRRCERRSGPDTHPVDPAAAVPVARFKRVRGSGCGARRVARRVRAVRRHLWRSPGGRRAAAVDIGPPVPVPVRS